MQAIPLKLENGPKSFINNGKRTFWLLGNKVNLNESSLVLVVVLSLVIVSNLTYVAGPSWGFVH